MLLNVTPGMPMKTLIDLFNTFGARGNKTVFVNRTGVRRLVVTYRELHDLALKMANLLAQNGWTVTRITPFSFPWRQFRR